MAVNTVISGCPRTDTSQNRYSPDEGGTTGCQLSLDGIRRLSRVSVGLRSPPMCGSGCIGGVGVEQNLDASSRKARRVERAQIRGRDGMFSLQPTRSTNNGPE